ncbi:MAG: HAMP domain-containing protein [Candidatus Omnitrophica bacterium]|nr:HAMP domain-containing protein [Candidatus Omnitrophota bacterium]
MRWIPTRVRLGLSLKVLIPIGVILACVVLTLVLFIGNRIELFEQQMAEVAARDTTAVFQRTLEFSMSEGVSDFAPVLERVSSVGNISDPRLIPAAFMEIDDATEADEWEAKVLASGEEQKGFIEGVHGRSYRVVLPIKVTESCIDCHDGAKVGQTMAAVGFRLDTGEWDDAARELISGILWLAGLAIVFLLVVVGWRLRSTIIRPLGLGVGVAERVAEGDLTHHFDLNREDEIGDLARALNKMSSNLRGIIQELSNNSNLVSSSSQELSSISEQMVSDSAEMSSQTDSVSAATVRVSSAVESTASAIEEMLASLKDVAQNCTRASAMAADADNQANETRQVMASLDASAKQISSVVDIIEDVARQTNLLSINAMVEAAKVGSAGDGFAVVANEVKKLALKVAEATNQVAEQIENIQRDAIRAGKVIEQTAKAISETNSVSRTIASTVEQQSSTVSEIAKTIQEISQAADGVSGDIRKVNHAAQNTSTAATETSSSAGKLAELAITAQRVVERFKV